MYPSIRARGPTKGRGHAFSRDGYTIVRATCNRVQGECKYATTKDIPIFISALNRSRDSRNSEFLAAIDSCVDFEIRRSRLT